MVQPAVVLTGAAAALLTLTVSCASSHDVERALHDTSGAGRAGTSAQASATKAQPDAGAAAPLTIDRIGKPVAALDTQFQFPEGPVWKADSAELFFTDISGDTIYSLQLPDNLQVVQKPAGYPDGLALGPKGVLYVAGFGARNVWRLVNGKQEVLADHWQGKQLNSPDDVIVRSDGVVYFTDPTFGLNGTVGGVPLQQAELDFEGVFRLDARGKLYLEDTTIPGPNGVRLSPDERTLYVSSTTRGAIYAYDVQPDGSLANQHVWSNNLLAADSFCLDEQGDVYIATALGISVVSAQGELIGSIQVSGLASNVTFGGPDRRSLFITTRSIIPVANGATGRIWRIDDMPVPGLAHHE